MKRVTKLSIAYCKKILESSGKKYSDVDTEKIRDLLYKLGELDYRIFVEMKKDDKLSYEQKKAA
ncbi:MAG: hypothetical protein O9302_14690 [Cyclobacteriaceae bacterium]|jgi:hypothetical protein|nr:hypothetical protein [Cytophagales bacterium]MCZ8329311.1 hypothetical protein [Cyclobacteriaceae bacterium]